MEMPEHKMQSFVDVTQKSIDDSTLEQLRRENGAELLKRENEKLKSEYTSMGVTLAARNSKIAELKEKNKFIQCDLDDCREYIDELQAKLDKAKKAIETPCNMVDADLMFCLGEFDNIPYKTVQKIARATADIIAQRARKTLEEIGDD